MFSFNSKIWGMHRPNTWMESSVCGPYKPREMFLPVNRTDQTIKLLVNWFVLPLQPDRLLPCFFLQIPILPAAISSPSGYLHFLTGQHSKRVHLICWYWQIDRGRPVWRPSYGWTGVGQLGRQLPKSSLNLTKLASTGLICGMYSLNQQRGMQCADRKKRCHNGSVL